MSRTLIPLSFFIGVFLMLPTNALAAVVATVGDLNNPASWSNSISAIEFSLLYNASPNIYSLGAIRFAAAWNSDVSVRIRAWDNNGTPSPKDCQTDYFLPSSLMPQYDGSGGINPTYSIVELNFSGTQCDVNAGAVGYPSNLYMELESSPGTQDHSAIYSSQVASGPDAGRFPLVISDTPFGPLPPTTQFNEVLYYIPDTGVNISIGTTTVGARFSIPEPTWIEYIGYRLVNPQGTVVYVATSTSDVAGIYQLFTDYDFNIPGVYTGHAFFAQDVGGSIWEVDNPTVQQIAVDVSDWTVDEGGGFTQNPATTSTTTLPNLTLDCGTGFVSSVCNLVARLVIPEPASIALVQSTFQALMTKAPFSFFTESRTILTAVRYSSGYQQSLAITMFGETFPIVSTSTAASIGLGEDQLDALKFLMAIGFWILLAWFTYWRIASIFGV